MRKTIDFTERGQEIIEFIQKEEGHRTFTAALHAAISGYYQKVYYSKYGNRTASTMTDPAAKEYEPIEVAEAYIKKFGGKMLDGKQRADFKIGAVTIGIGITDDSNVLLRNINEWRIKAAMPPLKIDQIFED